MESIAGRRNVKGIWEHGMRALPELMGVHGEMDTRDDSTLKSVRYG